MREFKREDLTFWGSMYAEQHKTVQRLNPRVSCFYSGKQAVTTYLLWMLGLIWFIPLPSDAFMTTHMTSRQMIFIRNTVERKGRGGCGLTLFLWAFRLIYKCQGSLLNHISNRNGTTMIWVVNHEEELMELKELYGEKLMGVMTDRPTMLKSYLERV